MNNPFFNLTPIVCYGLLLSACASESVSVAEYSKADETNKAYYCAEIIDTTNPQHNIYYPLVSPADSTYIETLDDDKDYLLELMYFLIPGDLNAPLQAITSTIAATPEQIRALHLTRDANGKVPNDPNSVIDAAESVRILMLNDRDALSRELEKETNATNNRILKNIDRFPEASIASATTQRFAFGPKCNVEGPIFVDPENPTEPNSGSASKNLNEGGLAYEEIVSANTNTFDASIAEFSPSYVPEPTLISISSAYGGNGDVCSVQESVKYQTEETGCIGFHSDNTAQVQPEELRLPGLEGSVPEFFFAFRGCANMKTFANDLAQALIDRRALIDELNQCSGD